MALELNNSDVGVEYKMSFSKTKKLQAPGNADIIKSQCCEWFVCVHIKSLDKHYFRSGWTNRILELYHIDPFRFYWLSSCIKDYHKRVNTYH